MQLLQLQLLRIVLVLIVISVVGTTGYVLIEGWGPIDSLYMTVITLSTVGFGEVLPPTCSSRPETC